MKIKIINRLISNYFNFISSLKRNYDYSPKYLIISFFIVFISLLPNFGNKYHYKVGDIADINIKSPKNILIFDKIATQRKINEAIKNVLPVFIFDYNVYSKKLDEIKNLFDFARKNLNNISDKELKLKFKEVFNYTLTNQELQLLKKYKFSKDIELAILKGYSHIMGRGVISDNTSLSKFKNTSILLKNKTSNEEMTKKDIFSFYEHSKVKNILNRNFEILTDYRADNYKVKRLLIKLLTHVIEPNVTYDSKTTKLKKEEIKKKIKPVYYLLKRNEIIVREGEKITEDSLTKLKAIEHSTTIESIIKKSISILIFLFLLGFFLNQTLKDEVEKRSIDLKDVVFLLSLITISAILIRISIAVALNLIEQSNISTFSFLFMIPFVLPIIINSLVLRGKFQYVLSIIISLFCLFIFNVKLLIFTLFVSLYVIKRFKCCMERITFFKMGLELGLINMLIIIAIKLFFAKTQIFSILTLQELIGGFIGGNLNSLLVIGIIPVIEILFNYTTDLRLIELGNLEHPLLKEFLIKAPGSYHHSMLVGNLAEAAAEAIGANPLLARVGSYYHDIGKMDKPKYFIENADPKDNKHEKLTPFMSALILISHVKEGVELVQNYNIGDEIIDIIKQHHGTSLIKFFYNKALELKKKGLKDEIDEKDFRYPGPKPQTKEAGIVMLADVVEAASRSLQDPTPARIKGLVKNMVDSYFNDGQLDECELTLKDLTKIKEVFTKILTGIFHQRVEYPDDKNIQRNKNKQ